MQNIILFICLFSLIISCNNSQTSQKQTIDAVSAPLKDTIVQKDTMPLPTGVDRFQTIKIAGHELDIAMPQGAYRGNLIILQGSEVSYTRSGGKMGFNAKAKGKTCAAMFVAMEHID